MDLKNKEILDSINYAKRLQSAILPPLEKIKQHLENTLNEIREAGLYKSERVIETPQEARIEVNGREEKWWRLAKIAKDAILKEDPTSPSGFSPDLMKRGAARRDFDRLSAEQAVQADRAGGGRRESPDSFVRL